MWSVWVCVHAYRIDAAALLPFIRARTVHFLRALEEAIVDVCIVNYPKDPIPFEENYELLLKVID